MLRMRCFLPLVVLLAACVTPTTTDPSRPPNVIWIMADDLGYGELGCYGQRHIRTPSIDRLAEEGMLFEEHYSGSPVCAPSRCILLTGLHSGHSFVRNNSESGGWGEHDPEGQLPLPAGTRTLPRLLQERGYATCAIGKWGLGGPGSTGAPNEQGFDHFFGYLCQRQAHNHYPTHLWRNAERVELEGNVWKNVEGVHYAHDLMTEEALGWVREHAEEPFFLYLPFHIPHVAIQVPEDSLAEYRGEWEDPPYDGSKGYIPHPEPRAGYAAMITRMDRDIGRLMVLLEELGIDDDTLIAFSSDNGPTYAGGADWEFFESAGPLRGLKGSVYEGGIRVPLVVRWPGRIPARTRTNHACASWDVLPTVVELAGGEPVEGVDGVSFAPTLLASGTQPRPQYLYWEFPSYGHQVALRRGDWKLVRRELRKGPGTPELYDLRRDLSESTDLAGEHPELVAELLGLMQSARFPSTEFPFPALDPE